MVHFELFGELLVLNLIVGLDFFLYKTAALAITIKAINRADAAISSVVEFCIAVGVGVGVPVVGGGTVRYSKQIEVVSTLVSEPSVPKVEV